MQQEVRQSRKFPPFRLIYRTITLKRAAKYNTCYILGVVSAGHSARSASSDGVYSVEARLELTPLMPRMESLH